MWKRLLIWIYQNLSIVLKWMRRLRELLRFLESLLPLLWLQEVWDSLGVAWLVVVAVEKKPWVNVVALERVVVMVVLMMEVRPSVWGIHLWRVMSNC